MLALSIPPPFALLSSHFDFSPSYRAEEETAAIDVVRDMVIWLLFSLPLPSPYNNYIQLL